MNAEVRAMKTPAEQALSAAFAAARDTLPGKGAVAALREDAFRRFDARGLPHRRVEEWKYTDLRALMRDAKPLAAPGRRQAARAISRRCCPASMRDRLPSSTAAIAPDLERFQRRRSGLTIGRIVRVRWPSDR